MVLNTGCSQVKSVNSCSEATSGSACWERTDDGDVRNVVTTPENLYLMGKATDMEELLIFDLCGNKDKFGYVFTGRS